MVREACNAVRTEWRTFCCNCSKSFWVNFPFHSTLAVTSLTSQNRGSMSGELGDEQSAG